MRIAIIAANGRLGKVLVEEFLTAGHSVRAGVRGSTDLAPHQRLEVVQCDATNPADVRHLLKGQHIVFSALGHVKGSTANVQTNATKTILAVMSELGLNRFVDVTGTGARFPGDKILPIDRFLNWAVSMIDPSRIKDGQDHVELLKTSGIDWTVIRVLKLQNVKPKPYVLRLHGPTKLYVGRREVAKAMLEVVEKNIFLKQAPIIGRSEGAK